VTGEIEEMASAAAELGRREGQASAKNIRKQRTQIAKQAAAKRSSK
jgi:hypothetical protein